MARPRNPFPSVLCLKRDKRDRSKWFAYANVNGSRRIFGRWKSAEAHAAYAAFVRQFQAAGGRFDVNTRDPLVTDVVIAAMERAKLEYRRADGKPSTTLGGLRQAYRRLRSLFGDKRADAFTVLDLLTYRESLIGEGLTRSTIVRHVGAVRKAFRWAAEMQMLPHENVAALASVRGVPNDPRVKPDKRGDVVDAATVEATLPHLSPIVADMVRLMQFSGMRPDECCGIRPMDLDRSDP